jgi:hypothetical protein
VKKYEKLRIVQVNELMASEDYLRASEQGYDWVVYGIEGDNGGVNNL